MLVCITSPPRVVLSGGGTGPRGVMDFTTGTYSFDGTTLTAADCIDHPEYISAGVLDIDPGVGDVSVGILGLFATFLGTLQFTVVLDLDITDVHTTLLTVESFAIGTYFESWWWNSFFSCQDSSNTLTRYADDFTHAITVGRHKVAITRSNAKLCLSTDGFPIGDSPNGTRDNNSNVLPDPSHPADNFHFGGYSDGSVSTRVKVYSAKFYDPADDTALPGLSA